MSPRELEDLLWEMFERCYSVPQIVRRAWRFRRQYVKYFPRDMAVEEVFFQLHMRNATRKKTHPFSLGLEVSRPRDHAYAAVQHNGN